jgi:hypothetical protein
MCQLLSAVCAVVTAASVVCAEPAPQALHEWAKAHARKSPGEPLMVLGPLGDTPPKTIAQLTREAEVVFHGRVYLLKTYLGPDGERVLSDYTIRGRELLAGRTAVAVARAEDASRPLIVTVIGGELTIEGVQVIATPADRRSMVDGGEYILFLMPSRGGGDRYEVYSAGIFEVKEQQIKPYTMTARSSSRTRSMHRSRQFGLESGKQESGDLPGESSRRPHDFSND